MSKNILLILIVLSIVIWLLSAIAQGFISTLYHFNPLSGSCQVTGYPISLCINSNEGLPITYYLVNIIFWFVVLFGIWKLIRMVLKK